jgi:hypothetical protein
MLRELFYVGPSLATLHETYAKQGRIDPASPVRSSSSLIVDAAVERVWDAVSDLRSWPDWYHEIQVLELTGVAPDAPFTWKLSGARIRATFAVVEPGRELSWTGVSYGFKAVDRHLLERVDGGRTRVTIEESMAGPLLPLLYRPDRLRRGHEKWLAALRSYVEAGK